MDRSGLLTKPLEVHNSHTLKRYRYPRSCKHIRSLRFAFTPTPGDRRLYNGPFLWGDIIPSRAIMGHDNQRRPKRRSEAQRLKRNQRGPHNRTKKEAQEPAPLQPAFRPIDGKDNSSDGYPTPQVRSKIVVPRSSSPLPTSIELEATSGQREGRERSIYLPLTGRGDSDKPGNSWAGEEAHSSATATTPSPTTNSRDASQARSDCVGSE